MSKVVTFGEIMMRLNPPGYHRFVQADSFEVTYAGGEANVAVSLANYGNDVRYCTKIPLHDIGQSAVNALRRFGVDISRVVRGGSRLGLYYVEKGASQRGPSVIYDRANSAISLAERKDFDWDSILQDADWFHWTGITPALGGQLPEITMDALKKCKEKNMTVSCDLNYRSKLWDRKKAGEIMGWLVPYVDVLIANEEDAKDVFGIEAADTDVMSGKLNHRGYIHVARQLTERFGCKAVAITLRESISASANNWSGMLYTEGKSYFSRNYLIQLVDRVGGGDSFGGGLIHAMRKGLSAQDTIEFAVAASCLKQTIEHDFNLVSEAEVLALMHGNSSGRVQR